MEDTSLLTIGTEAGKQTALDYAFLRQQGLEIIQELCSDSWTDYNLHDPGITILEVLCFALTDLAYRTGFPVEDLLCDPHGVIQPRDNSFFLKEEILTSNPVTCSDYRKVLLDEMDELCNVWVEPVQSDWSPGIVQGLLQLTIQVNKDAAIRLQQEKGYEKYLVQQLRKCF